MANPLEIIKKNLDKSQLGQAISNIPSDTRTPQERVRDSLSQNPYTPAPVAPEQTPLMLQPQAPQEQIIPASMPMQKPVEMQPNQRPPGSWYEKANPSTQSLNPFKQADQMLAGAPNSGDRQQMALNKDIGNIQSQGFDEQAKVNDEYLKNLDASEQNIKSIQKEREAAILENEKKIDESTKDLAGFKIDNERLWKNKSTGSKVLTALGLALSVLGGPEAVARTNQLIQGQIDRDIQDQKDEYGIKKEGVENQKGIYARLMDKYKDKEKAEIGTQLYYLNKAKAQNDSLVSRTGSALAKKNGELQSAQFQSKIDVLRTQLGLTIASSAAKNQVKADDIIPDNYTPRDDEERKRYVRGVGLATDSESAKGLRTDLANFNQFNDKITQLIKLRQDFGSETLPSETKGIMKQLATEALLAKKSSAKLGVMSDSDRALLEDIVADPTSFNPNTLGRMKALKDSTLSDFSRNVQPSLLNPVQSFGANLRKGSF